jgi:hypothetical protein
MSVYGFNPGYSLTFSNLSDTPAIGHNAHKAQQLYTPNLLSMNNPQATLMQAEALVGGSSASVGQYNMMSSSIGPASKCKNFKVGNVATAGAAQCIDANGMCTEPINMRCPDNTMFLNQFNGATASQPAMLSYGIYSK